MKALELRQELVSLMRVVAVTANAAVRTLTVKEPDRVVRKRIRTVVGVGPKTKLGLD